MRQTPAPESVLRQHVDAVSRRLTAARTGEMEAIHRARIATRRLRETLPLLAAGARGRKLERAVRRLTRALGPLRELDVSLVVLDELQQAESAPPAVLDCVRQSIAGERLAAHARAVKRIDKWDAARMRKRAAGAVRSADVSGRPARIAPRLGAARRRAARRAEQLRAAIEHAAGLYLPDRLHEVRVALKKLRYALELIRPLRPAGAARARGSRRAPQSIERQLALLKRMQDLLGRMHDFEVLIARTRGVQSSAHASDLRLAADLDGLVRVLETECRQLHGHYMAGRAQLLETCARVSAAATRRGSRPLPRAGGTFGDAHEPRTRSSPDAPGLSPAPGPRRARSTGRITRAPDARASAARQRRGVERRAAAAPRAERDEEADAPE